MLRVAVVGVGWAGTRHVRAIRELAGSLQVACLVDPDAEHLAAKSVELGVQQTYPCLADALQDDAVDAVSICSPHAFHCPQAIQAAEAGKHVLVEKPMAMDVGEATRMLGAADAAGVRLYVAESAVYTDMARTLRRVVRSGRHIGALTAASVSRGFRGLDYGYSGRRAWLGRPQEGGTGTWMLHGIHTVGQLRYVLGEVTTVYVREHKVGSFSRRDVEGTVSGLLTLQGGVHVALLQTPETKLYANLGGYVLHGDQGSVRAWEEGYEVFTDEQSGNLVPYEGDGLSPFARELAAFADYILDGVEGPTTGRSERRSLAVVQAGYESADSGWPVVLEERFGPL